MNAQGIKARKEAQEHMEFVQALAQELHEEDTHVCYALHLIVRSIGMEAARKLLQVVLHLEKTGGLMTIDGSRRRTVGGVFFWCAKQQHGTRLSPAFWHANKSKKQEQTSLHGIKIHV